MAAGYKSMLAPWLGRVGVPATAATVAFRGPLAFWLGGGSTPSGAPAVQNEYVITARRRMRK